MIVVANDGVFGKNIRCLRLKKHISQKALARELGISVRAVRLMEAGHLRELEYERLKVLYDILGTNVESILEENMQEQ